MRFEGGYLVPRGDGRLVLGATVEERGFDTSVTAWAVHELLRDAAELVPGVSSSRSRSCWLACGPARPTTRRCSAPSPALDGLVWATGHHRNGILLAPVTAELVAAELAGERRRPPLRPRPLRAGGGGAGVIWLNGGRPRAATGRRVADLLADLGVEPARPRGVAVAVDGEVVPRAEWPRRRSPRAPGSRR